MMRYSIFTILFICIIMISCKKEKNDQYIESCKKEIIEIEREFANMAKNLGIKEAFVHFADENAVLNRGNKLIKGKLEIAQYLSHQGSTVAKVILEWEPDFVDVSESCDLAYTYGPYTFTQIKKDGEEITSNGIFHTVWKRQEDGSWKYVWD